MSFELAQSKYTLAKSEETPMFSNYPDINKTLLCFGSTECTIYMWMISDCRQTDSVTHPLQTATSSFFIKTLHASIFICVYKHIVNSWKTESLQLANNLSQKRIEYNAKPIKAQCKGKEVA